MRQDLLEKLERHSIKRRELETLLKGSHMKWIKRGFPPIIVASHDKDLKPYLIRQVIQVLKMGGVL